MASKQTQLRGYSDDSMHRTLLVALCMIGAVATAEMLIIEFGPDALGWLGQWLKR